MSSHTPEDLRRIMLLLKGKRRAGRDLGKLVAASPNGKFYRSQIRASRSEGVGETVDRLHTLGTGGGEHDLDPEMAALLQLLESAQASKSKLRARGVGR